MVSNQDQESLGNFSRFRTTEQETTTNFRKTVKSVWFGKSNKSHGEQVLQNVMMILRAVASSKVTIK